MRTFEHYNQSGDDVCPICGTNKDEEIVLIPIMGTESGNNIQAIQVHTECLQKNLSYDKSMHIIYTYTK